MNLAQIQDLATQLAAARLALQKAAAKYNAALQRAVADILPAVREQATQCANAQHQLLEAVRDNPDAFKRPKSHTILDVKFGLRKVGGGILYGDPAEVVSLIERRLPDQIDQLIHVVKSPNKNGIKTLPAADLRKIGCGLIEPHDEPFVQCAQTDLDRLVKAILNQNSQDQSA